MGALGLRLELGVRVRGPQSEAYNSFRNGGPSKWRQVTYRNYLYVIWVNVRRINGQIMDRFNKLNVYFVTS